MVLGYFVANCGRGRPRPHRSVVIVLTAFRSHPFLGSTFSARFFFARLLPGTAAALGRINPSDCDEWFLVISWPIAAGAAAVPSIRSHRPYGLRSHPFLGSAFSARFFFARLLPGTAAALGRINPSDCDEWFLVISWPIAAGAAAIPSIRSHRPNGLRSHPFLGSAFSARFFFARLLPGTAAALGRINPSDCDEWFLVISWPIAAGAAAVPGRRTT